MESSSIEKLVESFLAGTLPKQDWTHEAHLKVGLWHLLHYSPAESLQRLRRGVKQYNLICGVANTDTQGYHETITCFYVWLIEQFIKQVETKQPIDTLADELITLYGDRSFPFTYYSKERLMSKTARLQWLEPDLKPLI